MAMLTIEFPTVVERMLPFDQKQFNQGKYIEFVLHGMVRICYKYYFFLMLEINP